MRDAMPSELASASPHEKTSPDPSPAPSVAPAASIELEDAVETSVMKLSALLLVILVGVAAAFTGGLVALCLLL